jgi:hypothetical protein
MTFIKVNERHFFISTLIDMSTKYLPSPLTDAYFSQFNRESLHRAIQNDIKQKTGYAIDRQNDADLQALMKRVYVNMASDPFTDVRGQLDRMNAAVLREASATITTGVLQHMVYLRDIASNPVPLAPPQNTSTYGNKLPYNFKIGG